MDKLSTSIWEGDDYYSIPEEIFNQLPAKVRAPLDEIMKNGTEALEDVKHELDSFISLIKLIPTTSSLSYIYHRLRTTQFEATTEAMMEQEMLTTAFVVTYARLFTKGNGIFVLQRNDIPAHLRDIHDELYKIRNERYAHNGGHESIDTSVGFAFTGTQFHIKVQMSLGFHIGGRDEWEELIKFIHALMHKRLGKILKRLKDRTGYEWFFPEGQVPGWVGKYGK
ncbi:hypothetical protein DPK04_18925 [Salmonella enterica subsp. enterica serovar Mikawasima]|uniref:hypothetical protein n=1 Tax=Enterobacter hormaechei TaxID=158836 RepID=UPI0012F19BC9|nr:hypothetical protein [Salmonella enterica subsp. enterica serovar Mikawasima]EDN4414350.1 hypothetical protein [Salmonella enterica subsp. enterica serovar Mbandaka]EDQ2769227.1 hypothetical protein [Salmonella enterica subsp. enterica serovar Mbandaka]EDV2884159.1 hypothetical protein [Salmonella enterica subsp. enterica serovar Mbandaka]EDV5619590.1 hypothetical protein [Salmonella enterica subsp. enterica serovar Mbandaka]